MRKRISMFSILGILFVSKGFTEESNNLLKKKSKTIDMEFLPKKNLDDPFEKIHFTVIPYTQLSYIFIPGYGVSIRAQKHNYAIQIDANNSSVSSSHWRRIHYWQCSIAGVLYKTPKNHSENILNGGPYVSLGVGVWHRERDYFMCVPFSIGYQGKRVFIDMGGIVLPHFTYPVLKTGICF